jgi:RHS repeat-associated protein
VRETQQPNPTGTGGRVVKVTRYNDAGDVAGTTPVAFYNSAGDGTGMVNPTVASLASYQASTINWAGDTTRSQLLSLGVASPKGDVQTSYPGADYQVVTDPDGHVTDTYHDVFGNAWQIVQHTPNLNPTTITTSYTHDVNGRLKTITDAAANVTSYTYDWVGHTLTTHDPDAGNSSTAYDANGNVASTTDAANQKLFTVYDDINRPTAVWATAIGTGTQVSGFTYDTATLGKGRAAVSTAYTGGAAYKTAVTAYDADGRSLTTSVDVPTTEGFGGPISTSVSYDAAGHRTTITYPAAGTGNVALAAETVTTGYTAGLPTAVSSPLGTYAGATYADYEGHLTARTWGSAATDPRRTYTYDPLTWALTNITTKTGPTATPTTVQNDTYTYDNAGNLVENASATDAQQQCYTVDDLNRLASAFTTTTASPTSCSGATANHTGGIAPYDIGYAYDKLGDITSTVDRITNTTSTYTYGDATHPHAVTQVARTGGATGTDTYGYAAYGAQSSRTVGGVVGAITYTPQDRPKTITKGAATTTYIYDTSGKVLIRKTAAEIVLYLPGEELHLAGTVVRPTRFYTAGGTVVAQRVGDASSTTGVLTWLANDTQASAQLSINPTTLAVARQRYLPFGAQRGTQGPPTGSNRAFLGHDPDPTSGLLQDGARLLDTMTGRFLSPDPMTNASVPQALDKYGYANDNPVTFWDPSGLSSIPCADDGPCGTNTVHNPDGQPAAHANSCPKTGCNTSPSGGGPGSVHGQTLTTKPVDKTDPVLPNAVHCTAGEVCAPLPDQAFVCDTAGPDDVCMVVIDNEIHWFVPNVLNSNGQLEATTEVDASLIGPYGKPVTTRTWLMIDAGVIGGIACWLSGCVLLAGLGVVVVSAGSMSDTAGILPSEPDYVGYQSENQIAYLASVWQLFPYSGGSPTLIQVPH